MFRLHADMPPVFLLSGEFDWDNRLTKTSQIVGNNNRRRLETIFSEFEPVLPNRYTLSLYTFAMYFGAQAWQPCELNHLDEFCP